MAGKISRVRLRVKKTSSRDWSRSTEINRTLAKMDSAILPTSNGDFASQARAGRRTKSEKPTGLSLSLSLSRQVVGRALGRGKKEGAEINRTTKRCSSIARRSLSQPSCVNPARRSRLVPLPRKTTHECYLQGVPKSSAAEQRLQTRKRSRKIIEASLDKNRRDFGEPRFTTRRQ